MMSRWQITKVSERPGDGKGRGSVGRKVVFDVEDSL